MKDKSISLNIKVIIYILVLIFSVVITYFLLPQEDTFDHYFEIGKPWVYDEVIAPKDFAIYKPDQQLAVERAEALKGLEPYLVVSNTNESVLNNFSPSNFRLRDWVVEQFNEIFSIGVISFQDKQKIDEFNVEYVVLVEGNRLGKKVLMSDLFTPKTAYDFILKKAEHVGWIDLNQLRTLNIDQYIKPNLEIDQIKTDQAIEVIINDVMLTSGMVQLGEKIIGRGEVVTEEKYQMLVSLKRAMGKEEIYNNDNIWQIVGDVSLIVLLYFLLSIYFVLFRFKVLESIRATIFMILMVVAMLTILWLINQHLNLSEYIVPFAILPLVVRVFFDSRTALYVHLITVLLAAQMVPDATEFIFLQILVGIVAVSSLKDMNSRSQLVKSALLIFVTYTITFVSLEFSRGVVFYEIKWDKLLIFVINSAALLFAYGLIYIIEKLFGFLSEVTLVELSNINTPLLMEFSEKCPGTFQHVLQVSNIAVEVAKKIGGNALLVRTGALYHDLGKMVNPMYYTENQTTVNPLNDLPYDEAAQIIISHVQEGVKIAEKWNLPYQIIEFISMHHGCSKVKYFYNSFKNKYPDVEIDEQKFTYLGPLPATKETAILMMSDAVEAASRSLKSYDEESISKLVEGVVNSQIADGQFRNAPISFRDVEIAKSVFKEKLQNIYHTRIQYPELKKIENEDEISALDEINKTLKKVRRPYRFQKK